VSCVAVEVYISTASVARVTGSAHAGSSFLHQIHPAAHFVPPHQCRVERLQQVAHSVRLLEAGVEHQPRLKVMMVV
jgi:hypothetical protein